MAKARGGILGILTYRATVAWLETAVICVICVTLGVSSLEGQRVAVWETGNQGDEEVCRPSQDSTTGSEWLERSWRALNVPEGQVLHLHFDQRTQELHQSDRTYPPYLTSTVGGQMWIDPQRGLVREVSASLYPTSGRWDRRVERIYDGDATWLVREGAAVPALPLHGAARASRAMDPISTVRDWITGGPPDAGQRCRFRDEDRVVLERNGRWGPERLYLDEESALPTKAAHTEPHYLWGQVRVETVFATWWAADGGDGVSPYPAATATLNDGSLVVDRVIGAMRWIPRGEAPFVAPDPVATPMEVVDPWMLPPSPDTVRVSERTFLLVDRLYTETVTLQADTVWLLDATLGDARARQDHEWIRRLFGEEHPVAVVVTDLAWPHVAGVRYWVSQGATIVSHAWSESFLRRVVEREWTLRPDRLEEQRSGSRFRFRPVSGSLSLAGEGVTLHTIGGIGSEGALVAWLPGDEFLWAGDFVQRLDVPTTYGLEVLRAVRREGLAPRHLAAQHLPLTDWTTLEENLSAPVGRGLGKR